jgi:hypothetical protein
VYDDITVEEEPTRDSMEDVRSQDRVGPQDMIAVHGPLDDTSKIAPRSEVKVALEKAISADSSFSEATDESQLDDEGLNRDSPSDDLDEIRPMVLEEFG